MNQCCLQVFILIWHCIHENESELCSYAHTFSKYVDISQFQFRYFGSQIIFFSNQIVCTYIFNRRSIDFFPMGHIFKHLASKIPWLLMRMEDRGMIYHRIFIRNSNSGEHLSFRNLMHGHEIAITFCTCYDSCTVVSCAKFSRDHGITKWIGSLCNFHRIWVKMKILSVK